jgi:hypothetical protein
VVSEWGRLGNHVTSEWEKLANHLDNNDPWLRFDNPLLQFDKLGKHVTSEWDKLSSHVEGEVGKLGKHIEQEWNKVSSNIIQLFQSLGNKNEDSGSTANGALSGDALELYISRKMEEDAKDHITGYLEVVSPLLLDIAGLFEEMNCDDLTKV